MIATTLRIAPLIDHAHRALAEFLLDLVASQHGLFDAHHQRPVNRLAARTGEKHGFRHLFGALQALCHVAELRIEVCNIAEHRLGLVELPLALVVERQVVHVFQQAGVHRTLAELVEGHVQLALALEGQAEHAVGLGRIQVRLFLAPLRHQEALGGQQQVAHQQQRGWHHQLEPQQLGRHQREVGGQQRRQDAGGDRRAHAGLEARQQNDQVHGNQQED